MKLLVLDFETYYSNDYTLKKMTTEEYIRDQRFEALMLGVYDPEDDVGGWIPRELIQEWCDNGDWENTAIICHHAHFDGAIFSWHYNVKPKLWIDTLSMANIVHGASQRVSLAALAEKYNLEAKSVPYDLFIGKRWHQLDDYIRNKLGAGTVHDCKLTYQIFMEMAPLVPEVEMQLIDTTIRMFTEPVLEGDLSMLRHICHHEVNVKAEAKAKLNVTDKELQSAAKFVNLLEQEGIEVEKKLSPKGKLIPAVAKTDQFMTDLIECGIPRVEALCEARLGVKSTLN